MCCILAYLSGSHDINFTKALKYWDSFNARLDRSQSRSFASTIGGMRRSVLAKMEIGFMPNKNRVGPEQRSVGVPLVTSQIYK
jgi:hypothetical protein